MKSSVAVVVAVVFGALASACRADLGSCDIDPTADCFKGKTGSGGTTGGSAGAGASGAAGSGTGGTGAAGTGGTGGTGGCDCVASPTCGTCGPSCSDGVKNQDESDIDCGGACPKCGDGSTCDVNKFGADCNSALCVDGVCCNSVCVGLCEQCDRPDNPGLCLPVAPGSPDNCPGGLVCGSAPNTCAIANEEACPGGQDWECADLHCFGGACKACQQDDWCGDDGACIDGYCYTMVDDGKGCATDHGCFSGHCVDGVCCESTCDGLCMGCNNSYTAQESGKCAPILKGYDPHGECTGAGADYCSGADPESDGTSACGPN